MSEFNVDPRAIMFPTEDSRWVAPLRKYKKAFTYSDVLSFFPERGLTIVDIGCGTHPIAGRSHDKVIGVDHQCYEEAEIVLDIGESPLPFENDSVDFIYCSHIIEHLDHKQRDHVLFECLRVLIPGGMMFVRVPHFSDIVLRTIYDHLVVSYGAHTLQSVGNANWYSKNIPFFHVIGVGLNFHMRGFHQTTLFLRGINWFLNLSHRFSEAYVCLLFGGIEEVQYLLLKPQTQTGA